MMVTAPAGLNCPLNDGVLVPRVSFAGYDAGAGDFEGDGAGIGLLARASAGAKSPL